MPLANCIRCETLFDKNVSPICPKCAEAEEEDFEKINEALRECPNQTVDELHEATEVEKKVIIRLVENGRVASEATMADVKCGRCGAPAISLTKRLCEKCSLELAKESRAAMQEVKAQLRDKPKTSGKSLHERSVHESLQDKLRE